MQNLGHGQLAFPYLFLFHVKVQRCCFSSFPVSLRRERQCTSWLLCGDTQQKYIYFGHIFLSMYTGQNKGSKWQDYGKAAFSVFKLDAGELLQMSSSCLKCGRRQNLGKQWEQLWSLQFTLGDQNPGTAAWLGHCCRSASLGKGAWCVRVCF